MQIKPYWTLKGFLLHLGLAISVTLQLASSQLMHSPFKHKGFIATSSFYLHIWLGMLAFLIVIAHWIVSYRDKISISSFSHLFPYNKAGRKAVLTDITGLKSLKLPDAGARPGLPGLVHGLGLLLITAMTITGAILFPSLVVLHKLNPLQHGFKEIHEFLANFVWIYWFAHVGMWLAHKSARIMPRVF